MTMSMSFELQKPDQLPVRWEKLGISDVYALPINQIVPWEQKNNQNVDEWRCVQVRSGTTNIGE